MTRAGDDAERSDEVGAAPMTAPATMQSCSDEEERRL
jgi:hypothetical protein